MTISLHAGRTTIRDNQQHLAPTVGTVLFGETILKMCDELIDAVLGCSGGPL